MSVEKRNKSKSVTYDQKSTMVDFLKNHEELAKGKHSSTFTQAIAKQQWEELTGILNSIPGPIKDWKSWRRTWQDLKADAKKKQALLNKNMKGTGGGPSTSGSLDSVNEAVVGMIGLVPISGDPSIMDYPVCFDFDTPNKQQNQSLVIEVPKLENVNQSESFDELDSTNILITDSSNTKVLEIQNTSSVMDASNDVLLNSETANRGIKRSLKNKNQEPDQSGKKHCETKKEKLAKTITAVGVLGEASNERNEMLKNYYEAKIKHFQNMEKLKERSVIAKEKIANALQKLINGNNDNENE